MKTSKVIEKGEPKMHNMEKITKIYNSKMRKKSGQINSNDKLVSFLYILMRDVVTPGRIEDIMLQHIELPNENCQFSNGWLAMYSKDLSNRLKND